MPLQLDATSLNGSYRNLGLKFSRILVTNKLRRLFRAEAHGTSTFALVDNCNDDEKLRIP